MTLLRRWLIGWIGTGCALWATCGAVAEEFSPPDSARLRQSWEQRVLRRSHEVEPAAAWGRGGQVRPAGATLSSQDVAQASGVIYDDAVMDEASVLTTGPEMAAPMESAGVVYGEGPVEYGPAGGCATCGDPIGDGWAEPVFDEGVCGGVGCGSCGRGGEVWGACPPGHGGWMGGIRLRNFSLFAGVDAFKGPLDQGRNGNFGFHEGLNWGIPLGAMLDASHTRIGFQLGLMATQSNFQGHQVEGEAVEEGRDQLFFTAGLFRRALCHEFQWGAVFDFMHDSYYDTTDVKQIRAELSYVISPKWEWGFWGAFNSSRESVLVNDVPILYEATDQYTFFYRRQFDCGGDGRLWAGFTGNSDFLLGTEFILPIGRSWALQNSFHFLIPKEGGDAVGQREESWSLGMSLVWYPGQAVHCALQHPYRPLLPVANNGNFMVDMAE